MGIAIDMAFDGATLAACPLSALVLSFAFYGLCGWAWESTVCAMLNHGRFANSGFLLGPCCPIYGAGGKALPEDEITMDDDLPNGKDVDADEAAEAGFEIQDEDNVFGLLNDSYTMDSDDSENV